MTNEPSTVNAALRAFAEVPNRTLLPATGIDVRDEGRYLLVRGPGFTGVTALDVAPGELTDVRDEVRELVAPGISPMWWLGPSTRPRDAKHRLLDLGLCEPDVSRLDAMIATAAPDAGDPAIEVAPVTTLAEFAVTSELRWEAFEVSPERRALDLAELNAAWEANQANCHMFLVRIDGRPAATAMSILGEHGSFLVGGCVAPWARGRGAYRALVRARWDDAVERGRPALVVHANPATSAPILRRLGFRALFALDRLEDRRIPGPAEPSPIRPKRVKSTASG